MNIQCFVTENLSRGTPLSAVARQSRRGRSRWLRFSDYICTTSLHLSCHWSQNIVNVAIAKAKASQG